MGTELRRKLRVFYAVAVVVLTVSVVGAPPVQALPPGSALSIDDVTVVEADGMPVGALFTVTLFPARGPRVEVDFSTKTGSATSEDFAPTSGTLVFDPDDRGPRTILVAVTGDLLDEEDVETFTVELSNASNAMIIDGIGTGSISDNDPLPSLRVSDASVAETDGGYSYATVAVSSNAPSARTVSVAYSTVARSAGSNSDYVPLTGTLTFGPGETSQTLTIAVEGDRIDEIDEAFDVSLSEPANAAIEDASGRITIIDNDAPPVVSVGDATFSEGNVGSTTMRFPVTLSQASGKSVRVEYSTLAGSADSSDFISATGSVAFPPGERVKEIEISLVGDVLHELDESFSIQLGSPVDAALGDAVATGTILDDDEAPLITIGDLTMLEFDPSPKPAPPVTEGFEGPDLQFGVQGSWTRSTSKPRTGAYSFKAAAISSGTSSESTFTIDFPAGSTNRKISLQARHDATCWAFRLNVYVNNNLIGSGDCNSWKLMQSSAMEGANTLRVRFYSPYSYSNPGNAWIDDIALTYDMPTDPLTRFARLPVDLSQPSGAPATVSFSTVLGSAEEGSDYRPQVGQITFGPGETRKYIDVETFADGTDEPDESFEVELHDASGALIGKSRGVVTLLDDDAPSEASIGDAFVTEGTGSGGTLIFGLSLNEASEFPVDIDWSTGGGSATTGEDYLTSSGTITFLPGEMAKSVSVGVVGDSVGEYDETILVNLSAPVNATIARGQGSGTIDNDDLVVLVKDDSVGQEWDDPTGLDSYYQTRVIYIVADPAPTSDIVVTWATEDGSATAGADYAPTGGVVTLGPGPQITSDYVFVRTHGDFLDENDETFYVKILDASGVQVLRDRGSITMLDDDPITFQTWEFGNDEGSWVGGMVSSSRFSNVFLTVEWETAGVGSATPGADYVPAAGVAEFPLEGTQAYIGPIITIDDMECEDYLEWIPITYHVAPIKAAGQFSIAIVDNEYWGDCVL